MATTISDMRKFLTGLKALSLPLSRLADAQERIAAAAERFNELYERRLQQTALPSDFIPYVTDHPYLPSPLPLEGTGNPPPGPPPTTTDGEG